MVAVGVRELDGVDALQALELEPREPGTDEVTIRVRAAGVGPWEELLATGEWDVGREPPLVLGVECSGVVERVGDGVERFSPGDAVLTHCVPFRDQGAWAEVLTTAETLIAPLPEGLDFERAGALPVSGLTAVQALDWLGVSDGDLVLITAASGATGGIAVELAAARGATVIATSGAANFERVKALGATEVIDSRTPDWAEQARAAAPAPFDSALTAAPDSSSAALGTLREGGRLATIVGDPPDPERGIEVHDLIVEADAAALADLARLAAAGEITIEIAERFGVTEARAAVEALGSLRSGAKVVLVP
jgi:NADPH:quinone reductase-like Zn-dependent oxidoreductase